MPPGRSLPEFNDYLDFSLTYAELQDLVAHPTAHRDWVSSLSAIAGVYLILAQPTGDLYIGSAYGTNGIWGRWTQYAANGHGGNEMLEKLTSESPEFPSAFRFSLLQVLRNPRRTLGISANRLGLIDTIRAATFYRRPMVPIANSCQCRKWHGQSGVLFIVICGGSCGGWHSEIEGWYRTLEKPLTNWVFGLSGLYLIGGGGVETGPEGAGSLSDCSVTAQLVLNVGWSWIFFGLHRPGWAMIELVVLWVAILLTTWAFFRRSWVAGWLMVPYLAWVSFAGALNFAIWRLN